MKKLALVFTSVVFLSTQTIFSAVDKKRSMAIEREARQNDKKVRSPQFLPNTCTSLLVGCPVGLATGSLVKYFENQLNIQSSSLALFVALLSWFVESEVREEIIEVAQADLDAYDIGYRKNLMYIAARLSSWLAYLN